MPFDREGGSLYIRLAIEAIEATNLSPEAKSAIYQGNARRLLRLAGARREPQPSSA
jgi:hypothetical protein